ncbi:ribonuclease H-like domain-containing protein [Tanacetum coccineum]|uniref:Ribonuclease H-like domain-containing protein n=1 Tax=Tanacetum coccineum TaxID=301880 RepID=A0ABQ5ED01_9ASTR
MLAERKYPLIKETLEWMISLKLIAESASESAYNLLRFIQKQIDEYGSYDSKANGYCKDLASPKKMALGKDISNPLIVDSSLKTIWLLMHHVIAMKHWLFQSKRLLWNSNSNSCRDVDVLSAGGTIFGTSFELDGLKDVPALKLGVPALTLRVCSYSYWLVISSSEPFVGSLSTLVVLDVNIFPVGTHLRPTVLGFRASTLSADNIARTTANADGTSTSTIPGPVTTEEKEKRKMMLPLLASVMPQSMIFWPINQMDLSLKARKFYQRTGKKIIINGSDIAGYDKSKVEWFNCHKMGHFARECRAMVAFDGAGFDWSFMVDEEVPTNLALMAFSDSEYDSLRVEFNKSEFDLATYKRGLASVEEQLVFYKKNKVVFCDQIVVLKRDASFRDSEINALNIQIEKLKKEKEGNQIKIDKFENASKSLDKLIGSQIVDKSRKGVGFENYNVVAPPPTGLFPPPTIDLSSYGLKDFQQPEFEGYGVNVNKSVSENSSNEIKKTTSAPIIKDWVSDCDEDESEVMMVQKPMMNNVQKGTGQREVRLVWNNALRTNHQNFSNSRRNFTPTAVLTKSGIVPISNARQSCSSAAAPLSAARPINTVAPKLFVNVAKTKPNIFQKAHSLSKRPFNQQTSLNNISLNNKVNTAKVNSVNTAKGKRVTSAIGEQGINVVKSSAC